MVLLFILLIGIAILVYGMRDTYRREGSIILGLLLTMSAGVTLIITTNITYYEQVGDIEELNVIDRRIEIVENRADNISAELKIVLLDYVVHEDGVFDKLSDVDLQILAVKYPEIRANELFNNYAETLKELRDQTYKLQLSMVSLERNIEKRKRYKLHVLTFLIPRE